MLTPAEYEDIQDAFFAVCDLPAGERVSALQSRDWSSPLHREFVESLLAMDDRRRGVFDQESIHDGIRQALVDALLDAPEVSAPECIGPYRVQGRIGAGGMGVVYEAVQDNPRRSIALKMMLPGLASERTLKRFRHESTILGLLQHPGIAQVYDAGTVDTDAGPQPYFAMELIRGKPLLRYADELRLGQRARLELFLRVCTAVQHAHTKGIIHRDLKPANILVTDDKQPKILDFGVARLTNSDIWFTTLQTETRQVIGTIPYSSPEQVAGDQSAIDTRSDVYSLGVILYEMLARRLPYDFKGKMLPEIALIIQREDPKPMGSVDRAFRNDLETIAAKALEKEQDRRYQTVADLAADIRRYLADEPILARPASAMYQLRKFAKRNRVLVSAAAAVLLALLAGLIGTGWGLRQAVIQGGIAQTEAAKYEQIAAFTQGILGGIVPDVAEGQDTGLLEQILRDAVDRIEADPYDLPEVEATVRQTIGETFMDLGMYEEAERHLHLAVALFAQTGGTEEPSTIDAGISLGYLYFQMGRYNEAESLITAGLEDQRRILGEEHEDTLQTLSRLAAVYAMLRQLDKAVTLQREALERSRRARGPDHPSTLSQMGNLAFVEGVRNRPDLAEPLAREVLEYSLRVHGEDHPKTFTAMNNLATHCVLLGKVAEGEDLLLRALEGRRRLLGNHHPRTMTAVHNLASFYRRVGRLDEAEGLYREAVEGRRGALGPDHLLLADSMVGLTRVLIGQGRDEEAAAHCEEVVRIRKGVLGDQADKTLIMREVLASIYVRLGRAAEAEQLLLQVVPWRRERLGETHKYTSWVIRELAKIYQQQGRFEEAEAELLELYRLLDAAAGPDSPDALTTAEALADLYAAWGRPETAEQWRVEPPPPDGP